MTAVSRGSVSEMEEIPCDHRVCGRARSARAPFAIAKPKIGVFLWCFPSGVFQIPHLSLRQRKNRSLVLHFRSSKITRRTSSTCFGVTSFYEICSEYSCYFWPLFYWPRKSSKLPSKSPAVSRLQKSQKEFHWSGGG